MNGCSFVELVKWSGNGIKEHKRVKGNEDRNCNFIQLNRVCRVEMGGIVTAYYERKKLFHFSEEQKATIWQEVGRLMGDDGQRRSVESSDAAYQVIIPGILDKIKICFWNRLNSNRSGIFFKYLLSIKICIVQDPYVGI